MIQQERLLVLAVVFTMALGLSLTLSVAVLPFYGIALAVLACAAVPYLLHVHQGWAFSGLRLVLPATMALAAPSVAHELGNGPFRLVGVFGPGALLYGVILAEYLLLSSPVSTQFQAAKLLLTLTAYGIALAYYLLTYEVKERSVISGPLLAVISAALALRLLTIDRYYDWKTSWYAGAAGLIVAEVFWPLNYWMFGVVAGGLALLLAYYVLLGIMRQLLAGQFGQGVLLEYGSVLLAGVLVIFGATRL